LDRKNVTNNEGEQKELRTKTIMEMFAKNTEVSSKTNDGEAEQKELVAKTIMEMFAKNSEVFAKTNDVGRYNMIIQTALFM